MTDDDYSDFGSDAEETAIVDALLAAIEQPLQVIYIEDHEAPAGLRLPTIRGTEARTSLRDASRRKLPSLSTT